MRNKGTKIALGILLAFAMAFSSVAQIPTTQVQAAEEATLNNTKVILVKGKTTKIKVKGGKAKSFKSSNTKVATVTKKGKVTAKKKGKATITVKVGKKSLKCKVTVVNKHKHDWVITKEKSHYETVKTRIKVAYYQCSGDHRTNPLTPCDYKTTSENQLNQHQREANHSGHMLYDEWVDTTKDVLVIDSVAGKKCSICGKFVPDDIKTLPSKMTICGGTIERWPDYAYLKDLKSSNESIVSIGHTIEGLPFIYGEKAGKATISGTFNGKTYTCTITVRDHNYEYIEDWHARGLTYNHVCKYCGDKY